ncbi:MAG: phosphate signaling complex protein PhoU [Candidatus Omnitrophica bacterium]|nr:phosphate signaling complex protein PhoU [Candidatus Omnitrophota bacterium]MCM8806353.1 phosphate signaling complex protein PhoU [Candidatus Omnitrophota bacterium]
MIEEKIKILKQKIIEFGLLVEEMIDKSIKGLIEKKEEILKEVIEKLEPIANRFEIEIDELCIEIIAQYEPKARNLRVVLMVLKINNDLERIGDHAVNICESSLFLIKRPDVKPLIDIPRMAEESTKMIKDSISSFIEEKIDLAKDVCKRDDIVDSLRNQITRELITYMVEDYSVIERALHLIRIAQNLERIADLSTNICEDVIFMIEGKIIKHHFEEG